MYRQIRESLSLVLIALLPFHALLITVGTKLIVGSGHAPLIALALWKELLLAMMLAVAVLEIFLSAYKRLADNGQRLTGFFVFDRLDLLILGLLILSIPVTALTHADWKLYAFGFKYDFVPLVAFLMLRRVQWSEKFIGQMTSVILLVGGIVAAYGIVSLFLPHSFFVWLGYSDLHSLYLPDAPLNPYQQIGGLGIRRMQSAMSGPNQLGLWLLLPCAFTLRKWLADRKPSMLGLFGILAIAMIFTFSRASWGGLVLVTLILLLWHGRQRLAFGAAAIGILACVVLVAFFPSIILRAASSRDHFERPLLTLMRLNENPFGDGLGIAGPASNRVSEPCVFLEEGSDSSWAQDHPALCVFVGEYQVQPQDRPCKCPFLTENWYLQLGVELGWLGIAFSILLPLFVLRLLILQRRVTRSSNLHPMIHVVFAVFVVVSVAGLVLHAWEDSAVAYTMWLFLAFLLPAKQAA